MIHPSDRRTDRRMDRQTDGRVIAYTRYSIYAVASKKCKNHKIQASGSGGIIDGAGFLPDLEKIVGFRSEPTFGTALVSHFGTTQLH